MAPSLDNFANSATSVPTLPTHSTMSERLESSDIVAHEGIWPGIASNNHVTPAVGDGMTIIGSHDNISRALPLSALSSSIFAQANVQAASVPSDHPNLPVPGNIAINCVVVPVARDDMITATNSQASISN